MVGQISLGILTVWLFSWEMKAIVVVVQVGNRLEQLEVVVDKLERQVVVVYTVGLAIGRPFELVVARLVRHFGCISFEK